MGRRAGVHGRSAGFRSYLQARQRAHLIQKALEVGMRVFPQAFPGAVPLLEPCLECADLWLYEGTRPQAVALVFRGSRTPRYKPNTVVHLATLWAQSVWSLCGRLAGVPVSSDVWAPLEVEDEG